jgi:hypothetical protein
MSPAFGREYFTAFPNKFTKICVTRELSPYTREGTDESDVRTMIPKLVGVLKIDRRGEREWRRTSQEYFTLMRLPLDEASCLATITAVSIASESEMIEFVNKISWLLNLEKSRILLINDNSS